MTTPRADDWRSRGGYFSWRPAQGDASPVEIFHVEMGDPGAPVLLLIHGWPTSSIDWFEVAGQLSGRPPPGVRGWPAPGRTSRARRRGLVAGGRAGRRRAAAGPGRRERAWPGRGPGPPGRRPGPGRGGRRGPGPSRALPARGCLVPRLPSGAHGRRRARHTPGRGPGRSTSRWASASTDRSSTGVSQVRSSTAGSGRSAVTGCRRLTASWGRPSSRSRSARWVSAVHSMLTSCTDRAACREPSR